MTDLLILDKKLVRFSRTRAILSGDVLEVYNYQFPYSYNFGTNKQKNEINETSDTSRLDNISRAQIAIRRFVNANAFQGGLLPIFITYTYAENMQSMQKARADFKAHIRKLKIELGIWNLKYVVVPELQARGAVHFHAVFFNMPYSIVVNERRDRVVANCWGHGFVDVVFTEHVKNLGAYISKYFGKQWFEFLKKGEKKYWCSTGLIQPIIFRSLDNLPELHTLDKEFEHTFDSGVLGQTLYQQFRIKPLVAN